MPWQLDIKRKDGRTVRADFGFARGWPQRRNIGDVLDCPASGEMIRAKVTAIHPTQVGADIGQPLEIVHAEEI